VAVPVPVPFADIHPVPEQAIRNTIRVRSSAACLNRGPLPAHVTRSSRPLEFAALHCLAGSGSGLDGGRDSR
jgi:hypothetical protein